MPLLPAHTACPPLVPLLPHRLITLALFTTHPPPQVGMRYFHLNKNKYFQPIINLDKLWSLVGNEVR